MAGNLLPFLFGALIRGDVRGFPGPPNKKGEDMKTLITIGILFLASIASADTLLDTDIGAIADGNVLAISRLTPTVTYAWAFYPQHPALMAILMDNEGNLSQDNPFHCPFLYLNIFASQIDVWCAWPGTQWQYQVSVRK